PVWGRQPLGCLSFLLRWLEDFRRRIYGGQWRVQQYETEGLLGAAGESTNRTLPILKHLQLGPRLPVWQHRSARCSGDSGGEPQHYLGNGNDEQYRSGFGLSG